MSDKRFNNKNLKNAIDKSGMTREQIAEKAGCDTSSITKYYNGDRYPKTDIIIKLAEIFNCSTDYLLGVSDVFTSLVTDDDKAMRISCDYTGLNEETIEFFSFYHLKCKDKNFMQEFIEFIEFFILAVKDDYSFTIDISDLIKCTNTYKNTLVNIIEKVDFTNDILDSPIPLELEDISLIKNIKKEINASKYTLSEYFKSVIDDFIRSKVTNTDIDNLANLEHKFYKGTLFEDI